MLSRFSSHPKHIHDNWPISLVNMRIKLCNSVHGRSDVVSRMLLVGKESDSSSKAMQSLSRMLSISAGFVNIAVRPHLDRVQSMWCVLPYSRALNEAGVYSMLSKWFASNCGRRLLETCSISVLPIRIAFSNGMPALSTLISGRQNYGGDRA